MALSPSQARARLDRARRSASLPDVLALFDALPVAPVEAMLGSWAGEGLATGNPLDGLLEASGWHGKRFDSADDVHPLVMADRWGRFAIDPALLPLGAVTRGPGFVRRPVLVRAGRPGLRALRTRRPAARLRMMEYRGAATATMVYDRLPIHDHVRLVDDGVALGLMDLRGLDAPFAFVLSREGRPTPTTG
ncbi:DUF4334 domain-containing protein [Agilicoccus flavus]|uniref:DUF4334 domain-containing protein n=1 Tax=Agilicoccus flavus TaxID=2775968 RepID=UPI001CF618D7|nr:DUF4334 domain-containing protein [Agilicoccus flavus]